MTPRLLLPFSSAASILLLVSLFPLNTEAQVTTNGSRVGPAAGGPAAAAAQSPNSLQQRGNPQVSTLPNGQSAVGTSGPVSTAGSSAVGRSPVGIISALGPSGFTLVASQGSAALSFQMSADTLFVDSAGRSVTSASLANAVPVIVNYVQSGNTLVATRVVASEARVFSNIGTLQQLSQGILVLQLPGTPATQVRYIANQGTSFVDQQGRPVPVEKIQPGTLSRVFYTKMGDNLIAIKVEVEARD